jgi:CheY-like chemotaxis protein
MKNAGTCDEIPDANRAANARFLDAVSHELRTPLNGVLGMAQAMAADRLTRRQRERLRILRRSGESLLALLDDLVLLSAADAGELELLPVVFDLPQLVRGVVAPFDSRARARGLTFELIIGPGVEGACNGDAARLRRLLSGLIDNAVKFTVSGGVKLCVERQHHEVSFAVEDTGIGISSEAAARIFDGFYQADGSSTRAFQGAGLGLAVCRKLVRIMDGSIEVVSEPGQGSTFKLSLPLPPRAVEGNPVRVQASAPDALPFEELRVLAAEDNAVNRLVLKTLLSNVGIIPTIVTNGKEALDAWNSGTWDLILMDVQMPVLDGLGASRHIRARELETGRPRVTIIAVTANTLPEHFKAYEDAGIDAVVTKPIVAAELLRAIATGLQASAQGAGFYLGRSAAL